MPPSPEVIEIEDSSLEQSEEDDYAPLVIDDLVSVDNGSTKNHRKARIIDFEPGNKVLVQYLDDDDGLVHVVSGFNVNKIQKRNTTKKAKRRSSDRSPSIMLPDGSSPDYRYESAVRGLTKLQKKSKKNRLDRSLIDETAESTLQTRAQLFGRSRFPAQPYDRLDENDFRAGDFVKVYKSDDNNDFSYGLIQSTALDEHKKEVKYNVLDTDLDKLPWGSVYKDSIFTGKVITVHNDSLDHIEVEIPRKEPNVDLSGKKYHADKIAAAVEGPDINSYTNEPEHVDYGDADSYTVAHEDNEVPSMKNSLIRPGTLGKSRFYRELIDGNLDGMIPETEDYYLDKMSKTEFKRYTTALNRKTKAQKQKYFTKRAAAAENAQAAKRAKTQSTRSASSSSDHLSSTTHRSREDNDDDDDDEEDNESNGGARRTQTQHRIVKRRSLRKKKRRSWFGFTF